MDRDRIGSFEDLKVWQEAHALTIKVFNETPKIPDEQQDVLAPMLEKAAIEVPRCIAEGFRSRSARDKAQLYSVAQSSLESLRYLFILCRDLNAGIDVEDLAYRSDQLARMLDGLVRSVPQGDGHGRGGGGGGGRGRHRRRGGGGGGGSGGGGGGGRDHDAPPRGNQAVERQDLGPAEGEDYVDDE